MARRLAGYRYGREISDAFMQKLLTGSGSVQQWLREEDDPRLTEIVGHLYGLVQGERER